MSNEFIVTDAEIIFDEIMSQLEAGVSEPLYPGDERRIFGESLVPLFVAAYNAMNDAARQKMLRYARGEVLDALGERVGVVRIASEQAVTTLRFSVASAVDEDIIIQEGTRVTSGGTRYFATTHSAVIKAGALYVDVEAVSIEGGSQYNDFTIGAINGLVDLIPYVDTVSNITTTYGGSDEEDDDNLRERIRLAPSQRSTAGSVNGYRYFAMSADASIADVKVKSEQETITRTFEPIHIDIGGDMYGYIYKGGADLLVDTLVVYDRDGNPATLGTDYTFTYEDDLLTIVLIFNSDKHDGNRTTIEIARTNAGVVKIVPICEGGELPDEKIREKVLAACNAAEVRPLTDTVVVEVPDVHEYDIELTYYTSAAEESACVQTVEGDGGAIDQYIQWQCEELGRNINPDKLRSLMLAPAEDAAVGAARVVITSPEFTELNDTTIARFSGNKIIRHEVSG